MTSRTSYRPTVQTLENRLCMAASIGTDVVSEPPTEGPIVEAPSITEITISGNTANSEGGGLWNSPNMTITGTTISGNTANAQGDGIVNHRENLAGEDAPVEGQDGNDLLIVNNGDGSDFLEQDGEDLLIVNNGDGSDFNVDAVDEIFREVGRDTEASGDSFRYTISDNLGQPSGQ